MQWRTETDLPSAVDIPTVEAEMVQRGIQQFKPMILQRGSPAICNHNHRPCRWFAQAPLGHAPGRAYRLVESSANRADFPGLPLKGLILFAFFHWLTRKRVNVFFDTHLVVRIILL